MECLIFYELNSRLVQLHSCFAWSVASMVANYTTVRTAPSGKRFPNAEYMNIIQYMLPRLLGFIKHRVTVHNEVMKNCADTVSNMSLIIPQCLFLTKTESCYCFIRLKWIILI